MVLFPVRIFVKTFGGVVGLPLEEEMRMDLSVMPPVLIVGINASRTGKFLSKNFPSLVEFSYKLNVRIYAVRLSLVKQFVDLFDDLVDVRIDMEDQ